MGNHFYSRLARTNLKNNRRLYFPYILTCIGSLAMFYIICFLALNKGLDTMSGGLQLKTILIFGAIVIGIFATIFLFYTNSFLIKRRKKEFGLFNILGMEKRHIGRVMAFETLYTMLLSMALGLAFGVLLSRLIMLLISTMMNYNVSFVFNISLVGVAASLILFAAIFFLTLLKNLRQVHIAKPAELLRGGNVGEREPKTKWLLTFIGILTLGAGYYIAITTKSPLSAIGLFFIAVILVIAGTYCLFTAGSIALLKVLRKNKSYYYRTNHFTAVSGMIYRMKQNAVGLGNICILSTMVLVMISGTVALFLGTNDAIRNQYPRNVSFYGTSVPVETADSIKTITEDTLDSLGADSENLVAYRYIDYTLQRSGNVFTFNGSGSQYDDSAAIAYLMTVDDYNAIQGTDRTLESGQVIVCNKSANMDSVSFDGLSFSVAEMTRSMDMMDSYIDFYSELYIFVFPDEETIVNVYNALCAEAGTEPTWSGLCLYLGFDTGGDQSVIADAVHEAVSQAQGLQYETLSYATSAAAETDFFSTYGGLFFLGVFLGAVFIMATVLIMYYKQVSEGYDDKIRFEIMQNIGMSKSEVRRSIRSQVLIVFFLPLTTAVIHVLFAFPMIRRLLLVMHLTNTTLYLLCTLGTVVVFSLLYTAVYSFTAKTYYKIVQQ